MNGYIFNFTIDGEIFIKAETLEEADTIIDRMTDEEIVECASSTIANIDFYKKKKFQ